MGSEMCIRDRYVTWTGGDREVALSPPDGDGALAPIESEEEDYT